DGGTHIGRHQPRIFRDDRFDAVASLVEVPDRLGRDARASYDPGVVDHIPLPVELADLPRLTFAQTRGGLAHLVGDRLEVDGENRLAMSLGFDRYARPRVDEDHGPSLEGKAQARPRRLVFFLEPGTHPPKFLQGNLALVAQHGDGSQADDVAEGVDAAKRPSAVLVD